MTVTVEAVDKAVVSRTDYGREYPDEAWDDFHYALKREEAVELPGVGWAHYVEGNAEEFGEDERQGQYYMVFKVVEPVAARTETFFRKFGHYQSWVYEGGWDGNTHEVIGKLQPRYVWETK